MICKLEDEVKSFLSAEVLFLVLGSSVTWYGIKYHHLVGDDPIWVIVFDFTEDFHDDPGLIIDELVDTCRGIDSTAKGFVRKSVQSH